ncbi:hypothetical protein T459_01012 [Capsicum annuum]|uniref:Uncharacterized protein n=1 Tax=Capsicum annuum TaxID=4072 RepID=A0A2G3AFZ5_CAPAN|nr:hypothetical protein T459_01012 [Capsicum annuum]
MRTLQTALSTQSNLLKLQLFVVEEDENIIPAPHISQHIGSFLETVDAVTDGESSKEEENENEPVDNDYNSDELEFLEREKKKEVNKSLDNFLQFKTGMRFKDLDEAKIFNNLNYKVTNMRKNVDDIFSLNVSYTKMKRVKRIILKKLEGGLIDDFNKLEAYAQELRDTNLGSNVVINLSKDALEQVVDRETTRIWKWFIELLRNSLGLTDGEGLTLMSDMQKVVTKSFNKWILIARGKPIIKMLEDIRIKAMGRLKDLEEQDSKRAGVLQDVPLSAPQPNEESVFMSTPGALVDEDETEDELEGEDEQPLLRPRGLSEAKTRLKIKKLEQNPTGTRKINCRSDDNGVSMPANLPYSPKKMTWKGKACVTSNQLAIEKEKKIGKLEAKMGKH